MPYFVEDFEVSLMYYYYYILTPIERESVVFTQTVIDFRCTQVVILILNVYLFKALKN